MKSRETTAWEQFWHVGMCFPIFEVSFDKNSFKNHFIDQMSLNLITFSLSQHFHTILAELVILPGQGVDSYFCPYFLTDFEYLL